MVIGPLTMLMVNGRICNCGLEPKSSENQLYPFGAFSIDMLVPRWK